MRGQQARRPAARPCGRADPGLFTADQWREIAVRLSLSTREAQIVRHFMLEATEPAIGAALRISAHTVHTHLERLYRKLGVSTRCGVLVRIFAAHLEAASARTLAPGTD